MQFEPKTNPLTVDAKRWMHGAAGASEPVLRPLAEA